MLDFGKHSVLGINVHGVDYETAVARIVRNAKLRLPLAVSALAVHGVMTGVLDPIHQRRLNGLDLVVPDGQPVRWALGWLHDVKLPDRVYGPELTLRSAEACAHEGISVYLYGSKTDVLQKFAHNLQRKYPGLRIAGMEPSKFRRINAEEKAQIVQRIHESGAGVVFVGLGCPRQEVWAYEYREALSIPVLAVGAAFDFHAGTLPQAPRWMQDRGLEWLFRLVQEPKRLWQRYIVLNPKYLCNIGLQRSRVRSFTPFMPDGYEPIESFG
ncbi:UDP-N-acetyl-D-mannosaminuronic acid transferase (plasmid) [Deinococcus aetherius]|uniref:UDP-N-acetyl-D-mannosaminuronic acid transferase n=1 Tax=Deinococcus aetherius TaxID=200252 RepID=A0ABM8AJZ4_9DEIO|nr:WecB/TagA/CpsF family glycosyltransferase [Deinococcus aetherius]BDP44144.1 UDP-N-acetyl-D-mannosaminuronic acid transferase [Deinococcus aetherius]